MKMASDIPNMKYVRNVEKLYMGNVAKPSMEVYVVLLTLWIYLCSTVIKRRAVIELGNIPRIKVCTKVMDIDCVSSENARYRSVHVSKVKDGDWLIRPGQSTCNHIEAAWYVCRLNGLCPGSATTGIGPLLVGIGSRTGSPIGLLIYDQT